MKKAVKLFNYDKPISPLDNHPYLEPAIIPNLIQDLTSDKCCLVIGAPGSGTSTVLLALREALKQRNPNLQWWLIDLDKLPTGSDEELFHALGREGMERFPQHRQAWSELKNLAGKKESIEKIFCRALLHSTRHANHQLILAIDHLEKTPTNIAKTVTRSVRSLYTNWDPDRNPNRMISIVMAGSHRLRRQGVQQGSPLNFARKHFLIDLEELEAIELLNQINQDQVTQFSESAAVFLTQMTNGDRYLLQRLGQACFSAALTYNPPVTISKGLVNKIIEEFIQFGYLDDPMLKELIPDLIKDEEAIFLVRWFLEYPNRNLDEYWLKDEELTAVIMRLFQVKDHRLHIRNEIYKRILQANEPIILAANRLHELNNKKLNRAQKFQRLIIQADTASESQEAMDNLLAEIANFLEIEHGVSLIHYNAVSQTYRLEATYPAQKDYHPEILDQDGRIKASLQSNHKAPCLEISSLCQSCGYGQGHNCNWLSLDLNNGNQHLGALILQGSPWTLSFPKEKELANLLTALASTLQSRRRRHGLNQLSEIRVLESTTTAVRGQLCSAIAYLFNLKTVYLWEGSRADKEIRLQASPAIDSAVDSANHLNLSVPLIQGLIGESNDPVILTNSFQDQTVVNDTIAALMQALSLQTLVLSAFSISTDRLGLLGIGSPVHWKKTKTEDALINLVVERVQTTLENLCFIDQTQRRMASTKRAAYLLSHELKSDPARIVREIEILKKGSQARTIDEIGEELARINAWAINHQSTVDRMLMFTWLDSQSWRPLMSVRPINPLIEGILAELENKMPAGHCRWTFNYDDNQNRHLVDSYSCYLIIRNLIQNSLQYAPGSPIYLKSWADHDATCVSVADEGPGVQPEFQANLFDPFNRGRFNDTRTGRPGNLGLGLYLVAELMKLHNGRVTYDTTYNQGARFILTFPPHPEALPTKAQHHEVRPL